MAGGKGFNGAALLLAGLVASVAIAGVVVNALVGGGRPTVSPFAAPVGPPLVAKQLRFEPNMGQWSPDVKFGAKGPGFELRLGDDSASLFLLHAAPESLSGEKSKSLNVDAVAIR